jgi:GntR family transcriptional repressor for pyruvate dehydrogenase complex
VVKGLLSYQFMKPFKSVKSGKISLLIAQQIKSSILNGDMKPGDRLPPERELVDYFQASRISVREALKNLETCGLLLIRPGSGVFVSEADSKPINESFSSILRIQKTSLGDLTEARVILEPHLVRLACEKISQEDFLRLENNIQEASKIVESGNSATTINLEFHSIIAETTHNPVVALAMRTMFNVWNEWISELRENLHKRIQISEQAICYHRKILEAFREKDPQKVQDLMFRHITQIQGGLAELQSKPI